MNHFISFSKTDIPDPPTNLASIGKTWESVKLKWDPGFYGGYDQTFFVLVSSIYGQKDVEVYPRSSNTFNVTRKLNPCDIS